MQRISTYRLALAGILCLGIFSESRISAEKAHLQLTQVLQDFPVQLGPFKGEDETSHSATVLRRMYWPAAFIYRTYTKSSGKPLQVFIAPDAIGAHTES